MQQDNSSFWTDIKVLEERLAANPDSYCFAKLSEIYLKVGLLDDALHTVRKGVEKHPRYLAGQRALATVCHVKGLSGESLIALKQITEVTPEDVDSQKLLGRLSIELGDTVTASRAFSTALEFAPEDEECQLEMEALLKTEDVPDSVSCVCDDEDEEILDDLEIIEDIEIYEDDEEEQLEYESVDTASPESATSEHSSDPLSTGTLAELYVSQGFTQKAIGIYRNILSGDPENDVIRARIAELEHIESTPPESSGAEDECYGDEAEVEPETYPPVAGFESDQPQFEAPVAESVVPVAATAAIAAVAGFAAAPAVESAESVDPFVMGKLNLENVGNAVANIPPSTGTADNAVSILEGWLENIRRIRS